MASAISHQPSVISHQSSVISHQPFDISHQPSAVNHLPSTIISLYHQPLPSAVNHQPLPWLSRPLAWRTFLPDLHGPSVTLPTCSLRAAPSPPRSPHVTPPAAALDFPVTPPPPQNHQPVFLDAGRSDDSGNCVLYVCLPSGGSRDLSQPFHANPLLFLSGGDLVARRLLIEREVRRA